MLVAEAADQGLMICRVIDHLHGQIFLHHLGKCLGDLIHITFVDVYKRQMLFRLV